ncbi:LysM peptidoglycan-binding domain-containing protein [Amycolatopsis anabasis]|uniref:LysM peptidoglycan-binding domain-containing protein n=1 Tax=Amycolatopsis anabasis TaxID=1840409 RepID=UPI00131BB953|nr:LysM peptidoglycan-binding domain-containing protein [Amycolatopsis anabasis]
MTASVHTAAAAPPVGAVPAAVPIAKSGARVPAMLRCLDVTALGVVLFEFNPKEISFQRTASVGSYPSMGPQAGTPGGASPPVTRRVPGSQIRLQGVVFQGLDTKSRCDTLLTWMSPSTGFLGQLMALAGVNLATDPPDLTFQWGPPMIGFMYSVKLTGCDIRYKRFTPEGIPIRAHVNLTLTESPSLLATLPTNPTSGGLPGRRAHTVALGETLPSIANVHYGRPGLWRRIAEINGITDPARLRPGTTVYLPNPEELR